jgi:hypothetical protein
VVALGGSRARVWGRRLRGRGRGRWPARVRIMGYLMPCREDVMHDVLIRCIGMHIYRLHSGAATFSNIQKRRGPSVNIHDT